MSERVRLVILLAALTSTGCSLLNGTEACDVDAAESLVNLRGDQIEHVAHARSSARLTDGRLLVAYVAASEDGASAEVRIAMYEADSAVRITLCRGDETELVLSEPGEIAYGAVAAAVELPNPGGDPTVAAVAWSSGAPGSPDATVRIRTIDAIGCPMGPAFFPAPPAETGAVTGVSLAASGERLLVAYQNGRAILTSWIAITGETGQAAEVAREDAVLSDAALAVTPDGRGMIAWAAADLDDLGDGVATIRGALLDEDARVRAEPFDLATIGVPEVGPTVSVSAAADRFAVTFQTSPAADRVASSLRLVAADDGAVLPSLEDLSRDDEEYEGAPTSAFLPGIGLLTVWESLASRGTLARVLDDEGHARFNALSCDEGAFSVGARGDVYSRPSSPIVVGDDLWIFHAADPPEDPLGTGVLAWRIAMEELWPGAR